MSSFSFQSINLMPLLILSMSLFVISLLGLTIGRGSFIKLCGSLFLGVIAIDINFLGFGLYMQNHTGEIIAMLITIMFIFQIIAALTVYLILYFKRTGSPNASLGN